MIKKVVPISILLASALGQDRLTGTWNVGTPTGPTTACCYYTGASVAVSGAVSGSTVTGTTNTASGDGTSTTTTGPCQSYMDTTILPNTAGATAAYVQTFGTPSAPDNNGVVAIPITNGAATTAGTPAKKATFSLASNGLTLTYIPTAVSGNTACAQSLVRPVYSISGVTSATGTPVAGVASNSATCCFLDTTKTVTLAQNADKRATISATFGTNCSPTGEQTQFLKAGTGGATGEVVATDISGVYKYTLSADKTKLTFVSGTDCTQTININPASSSNKVAGMTVVGAAVLGLVVV